MRGDSYTSSVWGWVTRRAFLELRGVAPDSPLVWIVVFAAFLSMFTVSAVAYSFGAFVNPMIHEFHSTLQCETQVENTKPLILGAAARIAESALSLSEAERIRITLVIDAPEPLPDLIVASSRVTPVTIGRAQPRHLS